MPDQPKVKKGPGPGRPRKEGNEKKIEKIGIIDTPKSPDNIVEFIYDSPIIHKKIFSFLKSMNGNEIKIMFLKDKVQFISMDHLEKSYIKTTFDCKQSVSYYCSHEISVIITSKNIEKVIQKIDKNYNLIAFICKRDTYENKIIINFSNIELKIDETHEINIINYNNEESNYDRNDKYDRKEIDYKSYPIQFKLPSKYFKKVINDISKFSNIFEIQRYNGIELQFPYETDGQIIVARNTFNDPKTIDLKSTLKKGDIFSVSTYIDNIKALSTSLISEHVEIFVDKKNDMVYKLAVEDSAVEILVYTEIIRYD